MTLPTMDFLTIQTVNNGYIVTVNNGPVRPGDFTMPTHTYVARNYTELLRVIKVATTAYKLSSGNQEPAA